MKSYETNVPVLVIFFNRPDVLSRTFSKIRQAKPSKLFLYQDGARNEKDKEKILQCRKIVDEIDWDCEVHRLYQEKNYSVDPSEFIAIKWAFQHVDRCIIIEDDDVASVSFFKFCEVLLEKYKDDERICRISAMNHLGTYECDSDYFFSTSGSIWGWATWKRVVDNWDSSYSFLDNPVTMRRLKEYCKATKVDFSKFVLTCRKHLKSGREHYESIYFSYRLLNNSLTIIPSKNMMCNIGLTDDSSHATSDINMLPKGIRRVFNMKTYEVNFPLKDPEFIINDLQYVDLVNVVMGSTPIRRLGRKTESKLIDIKNKIKKF